MHHNYFVPILYSAICPLQEAADRIKMMLSWDVLNGVSVCTWCCCVLLIVGVLVQVSRRTWSGHRLAKETLCEAMTAQPKLNVTIPHEVNDPNLIDRAFQN